MIGTVLYAGTFEPKPDAAGNAVQNFTVQVPDGVAEGAARLSVAHFYILGVRPPGSPGPRCVLVNGITDRPRLLLGFERCDYGHRPLGRPPHGLKDFALGDLEPP